MDSKYEDEPPSAKVLEEGYNQTYIIMTRDEKAASEVGHEVLFRCGNWCYKGLVQFNDLNINLEEVPLVIPTLQKQQGSLRYFCTAKRYALCLLSCLESDLLNYVITVSLPPRSTMVLCSSWKRPSIFLRGN